MADELRGGTTARLTSATRPPASGSTRSSTRAKTREVLIQAFDVAIRHRDAVPLSTGVFQV